MAVREGIKLEGAIRSDLAPLDSMARDLIQEGLDIHCMRDLTRGGLASGLNEIASMTDCSIRIVENSIPVHDEVLGACEILGFDPLYVANEGRFVVILPRENGDKAVEILRRHKNGNQAEIIGSVEKSSYADLLMTSSIG